jgi:hypothetical protein
MSHSIQPTALQLAYLSTLQSSRHLYAGTVPEHVIAKRRARNKHIVAITCRDEATSEFDSVARTAAEVAYRLSRRI